MLKPFLFIPLASVMGVQQDPQVPPPDRKVRIEVVTKENGETKRITKELNGADEAQVQDALREMGVLGQMKLGSGERDLTIDIRGFGDGEDEQLQLRMAPMPPLPPMPPDAPMALHSEPVAYLGVSTRNLTEEDRKERKLSAKQGAVVEEVVEDSPAAELGLSVGDVITEVGGIAVDGPQQLAEAVRKHKPEEEVKVVWLRDGKTMKGTAKLGQREAHAYAFRFSDDDELDFEEFEDWGEWKSERKAFLGVTPDDDAEEQSGVVIESVEEGSAAEQMGLRAGDRITAINDKAIEDFDALAERIGSMKPGDEVKVDAEREGASQSMSGILGERKAHVFFHGPGGMHGFRMEGVDPEVRHELRREMNELRREMDELRREMGKDIRREVRIHVQTRKLSEEEKALLRGKGVAVDSELKLDGMQVFPNPSSGFFRLQFDVPERGDLAVDVHNAKGERVYQERIVGFKGRYERTLDLSDQAGGSYYLVVTQGGRTATSKLVKE